MMMALTGTMLHDNPEELQILSLPAEIFGDFESADHFPTWPLWYYGSILVFRNNEAAYLTSRLTGLLHSARM
jgi:hypothetical protein